MTARARCTPRVHKGVDRDALRREYDGGRGGSVADIARQHGLPVKTVQWYAFQDGWKDDRPPRGPTRDEVRTAAKRYVAEHAEQSLEELRPALVKRFGNHPVIPTVRGLRFWLPRKPRRQRTPRTEPRPLDGLQRRCWSAACTGRITTADPCAHCGTRASEVPFPA